VTVNHCGQKTKSVIAIAPEGFMLADLNESPQIWRHVQQDRHRGIILGEDDEIQIHNGEQRIFARVNYADGDKVVVYDIKVASKPVRDSTMWSDSTYEVRHVREGGYTYFRITDGVRMSVPTYPSVEAARSACVREMYPAKVA